MEQKRKIIGNESRDVSQKRVRQDFEGKGEKLEFEVEGEKRLLRDLKRRVTERATRVLDGCSIILYRQLKSKMGCGEAIGRDGEAKDDQSTGGEFIERRHKSGF